MLAAVAQYGFALKWASEELKGDEVVVQAGEHGVRFLLISGAPIREPVAWHGPIVMNTREELITAVNELRSGTFIKEGVRKS